jgi:ATP-binding cassette subfamily C protein CydC
MREFWRELAPFVRLLHPYRLRMTLGTILGLTAVAAAAGLLALAGWFLTAAALAGLTVTGAGAFNFFFPSIGVRLFAFARIAARYLERIITHDVTFRILAGLRVWFYQKFEPLVPACLAKHHSGDILNRLVEDVDTLDNLYLRVFSPTAVTLAMSFMLLLFLLCFDGLIAITGFFALLIAGFSVAAVVGVRGAAIGREMGGCSARLRIRLIEGFRGLGELLVFGARNRHVIAIAQDMKRVTDCQLRMSRLSAFSGAAIILFSGTAVTTVLYIGIDRVGSGRMTGASLALLTLAILAAFECVQPLPVAYQYLGRSREAGRRIREIIDAPPAVRFPEQSIGVPREVDVTFENVSFHYPDHGLWALRKVDVSIRSGTRVAVLGETGSGKSTLLNLLVRFWDPSEGRLLMAGQDLRHLTEGDLRQAVNAVPQTAHMFGKTIRENLLLARADSDDAQLREALDAACLLTFVDTLPDGMDTWVGESGKLLSGGEARRLAMARCFLKDGPIWVLDEPTEGLDQSTEQQLLSTVFERTEGKTLLLITHRLVDLHRMDHIIVLKAGRVAAQGTYEAMKDRFSQGYESKFT